MHDLVLEKGLDSGISSELDGIFEQHPMLVGHNMRALVEFSKLIFITNEASYHRDTEDRKKLMIAYALAYKPQQRDVVACLIL